MSDPHFQDQIGPITGDKRDRVIPATTMRRKVLFLDNARENEHLVLPGDFLFADRNSTGQVDIRLNSTGEDPWPVTAQDGVRDVPMRDVFVTHAAQAGRVVNLWYGYRALFLAGANSIASIGSILNAVTLAAWIGKNRIRSPGFMAGFTQAGVAATNSFGYLNNPVGSGVTLYLDRLIVGQAGASAYSLRENIPTAGADRGFGINKTIGGAASVAKLFTQTNAAVGGTDRVSFSVQGDDSREIAFEEPVIIPPGNNFGVLQFALAVALRIGFEWREV